MRFSRKFYFLALLLFVWTFLLSGGTPYVPPPPPPPDLPDFPDIPDLPPLPDDPFDIPFDPTGLPDPIEIPPPPEDPWDDPLPDFPLPDPPEIEDPFPDLPSFLPGIDLGFSAALASAGSVPSSVPAAGATNTVAKLMPFPMRVPFPPAFGEYSKRISRTMRVCDPNNASQLIIPESKKNTAAFVSTCPWAVTMRLPVGIKPTSVAGTPDGQLALVTNCGPDCINFDSPSVPGSISVINIASRSVTRTIPFQNAPDGLPVRPNNIAVMPDGSRAYVGSHGCTQNGSFVFIVDLSTFNVIGNIPVGCYPSQMAVTPDGSQLWVSDHGDNRVEIFDTATNASVFAYNILLPNAIAFSPNGTTAYIAEGTGPGDLVVIDTSTYQIVTHIPLGNLPHAVAVTPSGHQIFVTNALSNSISEINATTNKVFRTFNLPNGRKHPLGLTFIR